jgi:hypothetical protein
MQPSRKPFEYNSNITGMLRKSALFTDMETEAKGKKYAQGNFFQKKSTGSGLKFIRYGVSTPASQAGSNLNHPLSSFGFFSSSGS